jgi:glycosyltransferase involved in cell wall biosynthesis
MPRVLDRLFNGRWLLRAISRLAVNTKYADLGGMTISMLRGRDGRQVKELRKLIEWLASEVRPDVIVLTNVLLSGLAPAIRAELRVPVVATLQGDDIFLDALHEPDRREAIGLIRENAKQLAGLIATSEYYADHMADYLGLDPSRIQVVPPGIDLKGHELPVRRSPRPRPVVGFFARIAPEKGLHNLVDAFIDYRRRPNAVPATLRISGWLGEKNRPYLDEQFHKLEAASLRADTEYVDSPTLSDKVNFLRSLDLLSVPTDYREPKGLYVLEALANGVPVLLPDHGCFPELVTATGGGVTYPAGQRDAYVSALSDLLKDPARLTALGDAGRAAVHAHYNARVMAQRTAERLEAIVLPQSLPA